MPRQTGIFFIICMALVSVVFAWSFYFHSRHQTDAFTLTENSFFLFASVAQHQNLKQKYNKISADIEQAIWQTQRQKLHRQRIQTLKELLEYEPANVHLWGSLIESQHRSGRDDMLLTNYALQQIIKWGSWHQKWRFNNSYYCLEYRKKLTESTKKLCHDLLRQTLLQAENVKNLMTITGVSEEEITTLLAVFEKNRADHENP